MKCSSTKMTMLTISLCLMFILALPFAGTAAENKPAASKPVVVFATTLGDITLELDSAKAPKTVENFLAYVDAKFYDNTVFHRVIPNFMLQLGGFAKDMKKKKTRPAIKNEADNGLANSRGTLAMARTSAVDSATSQFFINLKANTFLDNGVRDFGYAVFGKVIKGMDVVDKIAAVPTGNRSGHQNVPLSDVIVTSARRQAAAAAPSQKK